MRLVIDFESIVTPQAIALARDLVHTARGHEVWVVASNRTPSDHLMALRHGLSGLIAPERMRLYHLPHPHRRYSDLHAERVLREHFIAALLPDCVFLPRAGDATQPSRVMPHTVSAVPGNADAAQLWQQFEQGGIAHREMPERPRLAWVSPLPPEKSGIADYSAELVPELARHYEIDLVVDQPSVADERLAGLPVRNVEWFEQHAGDFDRILYHVGNSHAHKHMFSLMRRHPGVVVLHDFYLSGVLDNLEREGYLPGAFLEALYESHGYTGLADHQRNGRNPSIWKYPVNKGVLDGADGVIVHSPFSVELARQWYGPAAARDWRVVPLLRGLPATHRHEEARAQCRARLGLAEGDYMVCSFGMLGRTKLNEELLDAFLASPLAQDARCRLVFVGENEPGLYGAGLARKIQDSGLASRMKITGFVDARSYADYLCAADCAVQLRTSTRGETSASVLDCLLYGVPTIVNAHGSTAALDPRVLVMLPDEFDRAALSGALARLFSDKPLRADLGERAREHMQAMHAPARAGGLYRDAIELFAQQGPASLYRHMLGELTRGARPRSSDINPLALAIARNQPATPPRQLLVDVSALVQTDLKTGIQRVVRSVVLEMIANPPAGWRVEPVFSVGGNRSYQYARSFALGMLGVAGLQLEDAPVELRAGDIFFGLDLFTNGTAQNQLLLQSMRDMGVAIHFAMYDMLPVLRPDVFPFGAEKHFSEFLKTVAAVADGVVCISRAVADELCDWMQAHPPLRNTPLDIGWFHLGADIDASAPSTGLPPDAPHVLAALRARPSFLVVGTVEPRKGHAQTLDAFERLWAQGSDANLVVVGKQGWMVDKLCERLASHPEKGKRLFWLAGISDEMLQQLYAGASARLAPSEGEGFGLPLIEAAQHGIPIIARDMPVFREVAGEHAFYFDGREPAALADALSAWLALHREGSAPPSSGMPWLTWRQSTRQALDAIIDGKWYRTLERTSP